MRIPILIAATVGLLAIASEQVPQPWPMAQSPRHHYAPDAWLPDAAMPPDAAAPGPDADIPPAWAALGTPATDCWEIASGLYCTDGAPGVVGMPTLGTSTLPTYKAAVLGGADSYDLGTDRGAETGSFTVAAIFKPTDNTVGQAIVAKYENAVYESWSLEQWSAGPSIWLVRDVASNACYIFGAETISTSVDNIVIATFSWVDPVVDVWMNVNGVDDVGSGPGKGLGCAGPPIATAQHLRIGNNDTGAPLTGTVTRVSIFPRAATKGEQAAAYAAMHALVH